MCDPADGAWDGEVYSVPGSVVWEDSQDWRSRGMREMCLPGTAHRVDTNVIVTLHNGNHA